MDDRDLAFAPAVEQAALIRKGELKPTELVELYLRRIEDLNSRLGAYLTVSAEQARAAARSAEAAPSAGDRVDPLFGTTVSIKDLTDTAGIRTTCATRAWSDRVPDHDDEIVARMRRAGLAILGKTNTPEFGASILTESSGYPKARNPWDLTRTPGGSSGGAGAAVAAALCSVAHGSDTGGSIRMPASLCGVVGFRPSRGRITNAPRHQRLYTSDGPLTRSVADAAAVLDVLTGPAVGDPWWAPPAQESFLAATERDPGVLRIAVTTQPFIPDVETMSSHAAATTRVADLLDALGHVVEEARPPWDGSIAEASIAVFAAEAAVDARDRPPPETLDPPSRMLAELGATVLAVDYVAGARALEQHARDVHRFFEGFDIVLTPTVPQTALPVGAFDGADDAGLELVMRSRALSSFTILASLTGLPAISIPLETDDAGLPVGLQLTAGPAQDTTVLRLAAQLESAAPWHIRRPPNS